MLKHMITHYKAYMTLMKFSSSWVQGSRHHFSESALFGTGINTDLRACCQKTMWLCMFSLVVASIDVSTIALDCFERFVSEMKCHSVWECCDQVGH